MRPCRVLVGLTLLIAAGAALCLARTRGTALSVPPAFQRDARDTPATPWFDDIRYLCVGTARFDLRSWPSRWPHQLEHVAGQTRWSCGSAALSLLGDAELLVAARTGSQHASMALVRLPDGLANIDKTLQDTGWESLAAPASSRGFIGSYRRAAAHLSIVMWERSDASRLALIVIQQEDEKEQPIP